MEDGVLHVELFFQMLITFLGTSWHIYRMSNKLSRMHSVYLRKH